jgi:hypothetical protein
MAQCKDVQKVEVALSVQVHKLRAVRVRVVRFLVPVVELTGAKIK